MNRSDQNQIIDNAAEYDENISRKRAAEEQAEEEKNAKRSKNRYLIETLFFFINRA